MNTPERVQCLYGHCVFRSRAKRSVNISGEGFGASDQGAGPLCIPTVCSMVIGGEDRHYAQEFVGIRARELTPESPL